MSNPVGRPSKSGVKYLYRSKNGKNRSPRWFVFRYLKQDDGTKKAVKYTVFSKDEGILKLKELGWS